MARDGLGRRDRFKRTPSGKALSLTSRDCEVLQWLYRYRYLRQDHLIQIFKPKSVKRFVERLGDLFHETGFINRPQFQAPLFDARATPMMYEISPRGTRILESEGALPHRAVTFSRRPRASFSPQFLHTIMTIEALLATELEALASPDQRFVPVDEVLARAPEAQRKARNPLAMSITLNRQPTMVIPDGLYGIEYERGFRFWALEVERTSPARRSNTKLSSTEKKQAAYDEIKRIKVFKTTFGIPNLDVRFVR